MIQWVEVFFYVVNNLKLAAAAQIDPPPSSPSRAGVSKTVTVDVRGSWQRWLKARDLSTGATYTFSVQALTVGYGPAIRANLTAQPVQGKHQCVCVGVCTRAALSTHALIKNAAPTTHFMVQFLKQICV